MMDFDEFFNLMDAWRDDFFRSYRNYNIVESRIRQIRNSLIECGNYHDVDRVVMDNLDFIDEHPELWTMVKKTRRRIAHLRRELLKSWELMIN